MRKLAMLCGMGLCLGGFSQASYAAPPSQISRTAETLGTVLDITTDLLIGRLVRSFANDEINQDATNTWVGFNPQGTCGSPPNNLSMVPGGFGPCYPNLNHPVPNAGLQMLTNLNPAECNAKALQGGLAVEDTIVPAMQIAGKSGRSFIGPTSVPLPVGGICDKPGKNSFAGYLGGLDIDHYILAFQVFSDLQCAYLVNMCEDCSCGIYHYP